MKALLVHSDLQQRGGAEDYANAFKMALDAKGWETLVLDVNGLFQNGRLIKDSSFLRIFRTVSPFKDLSLLKYAAVCRYMRGLRQDYDLVVYTYGEGPKTSCKTLRIMHAPALFSTTTEMLSYLGVDGTAKLSLLGRKLYAWSCRILAAPFTASGPDIITVTNSEWTRGIVSRAWGIGDSHIIYPRVALSSNAEGRQHKKDRLSFIALGRIVPNKRLEDAIEIIDQLRARGHDCTLDIIGRANTPYARELAEICRTHPAVTLHPDASEEEKAALIAKARFGLHCYRNEHFGIAVAEMLLLGCIPIVFNGGGVTELVTEPRQRYADIEEAVENISRLLQLPEDELKHISITQKDNKALARAMRFDTEVATLIDAIGADLTT